jgi:hypothetical protein
MALMTSNLCQQNRSQTEHPIKIPSNSFFSKWGNAPAYASLDAHSLLSKVSQSQNLQITLSEKVDTKINHKNQPSK